MSSKATSDSSELGLDGEGASNEQGDSRAGGRGSEGEHHASGGDEEVGTKAMLESLVACEAQAKAGKVFTTAAAASRQRRAAAMQRLFGRRKKPKPKAR